MGYRFRHDYAPESGFFSNLYRLYATYDGLVYRVQLFVFRSTNTSTNIFSKIREKRIRFNSDSLSQTSMG